LIKLWFIGGKQYFVTKVPGFFKGFHRFFVKKDAWEGIAEQGGLWKRRQRGDSVEEDAEKVNPR